MKMKLLHALHVILSATSMWLPILFSTVVGNYTNGYIGIATFVVSWISLAYLGVKIDDLINFG